MGDERLLRLFSQAGMTMRAVQAVILQQHGIYLGQEGLLAVLWASDGQTPGELAARLEVSVPTVVRMAKQMEAGGLLVRRRDGRVVRLYLTPRAKRLEQPLKADLAVLAEQAVAGLTAAEHDVLERALTSVVDRMQAMLEQHAESGLG
ncbi:MAG TPA: MarR family transcriptional regulator [Mycobacteriales bacterium]|jgi:MarR family transcriptional regulator for hemolysin|nr:MarR family transcriptional regulator [Mycobacteriales bacterium]